MLVVEPAALAVRKGWSERQFSGLRVRDQPGGDRLIGRTVKEIGDTLIRELPQARQISKLELLAHDELHVVFHLREVELDRHPAAVCPVYEPDIASAVGNHVLEVQIPMNEAYLAFHAIIVARDHL